MLYIINGILLLGNLLLYLANEHWVSMFAVGFVAGITVAMFLWDASEGKFSRT